MRKYKKIIYSKCAKLLGNFALVAQLNTDQVVALYGIEPPIDVRKRVLFTAFIPLIIIITIIIGVIIFLLIIRKRRKKNATRHHQTRSAEVVDNTSRKQTPRT